MGGISIKALYRTLKQYTSRCNSNASNQIIETDQGDRTDLSMTAQQVMQMSCMHLIGMVRSAAAIV